MLLRIQGRYWCLRAKQIDGVPFVRCMASINRVGFNVEKVLQRAFDLADLPDVLVAERKQRETDFRLGTVSDVGNESVTVKGLGVAPIGATVIFETKKGKERGLVTKIENGCLTVIMLTNGFVRIGDLVLMLEQSLTVPCGKGYEGRVVNALGKPLDGKGPIEGMFYQAHPFRLHVPSIVERMPVEKTVQSGVKHLDFLHPVARGLRVGFFGGPNTGSFDLITDILSNLQHAPQQHMHVVYVLIGQSHHQLTRLVSRLEKTGAMRYTTIVCGLGTDPVGLQYLAPWTGAMLANLYRDNGGHSVIVYDDLAIHAGIYKSFSPPSAYPAITNFHAWLLEHSAQVGLPQGGGSCTALVPIQTETEVSTPAYRDQLSSFLDHVVHLDSDVVLAKSWPPLDCRSYLGRPPSRFLPALFRDLRIALNERLRQSESTANHFEWARAFGVDQTEDVDMTVMSYRDRVQELLVQPRSSFVDTAHLLVVLTAAVEGLPAQEDIPEFENDIIARFLQDYPSLNEKLNALHWEHEFPIDLQTELTSAVRALSAKWNVQSMSIPLL